METQDIPKRPNLQAACDAAGGQTEFGKLIGKDQGFVWHLLNRSKSIKADVAIEISEATGLALDEIMSDFKSEVA